MTAFTSYSTVGLSPARRRRRAPAWRFGWSLRAAAQGWLTARARRRDYARLADLPDEVLEDAGLLRHPEIVRLREERRSRSRVLFGGHGH